MQKAHAAYGRSRYCPPGVPNPRDSTTKIDQVHDVTAQHTAMSVGIIWQHNLRVFRKRFSDGTSWQCRTTHTCFLLAPRPYDRISPTEITGLGIWAQIAKNELSRSKPSVWLVQTSRFHTNGLFLATESTESTASVHLAVISHTGKDVAHLTSRQTKYFTLQPRCPYSGRGSL